MTASADQGSALPQFASGQRLRLPGEAGIVVVDLVARQPHGLDLYVKDEETCDQIRKVSLTVDEAHRVRPVSEDGEASADAVIAGFWTEWMLSAVRSARSTVLASTTLRPYPHQMEAVYGQMLTQPLLRFLLADEPGTGKTIMSGLWLGEAQRLGMAKRALVVCPAHLVIKWKADFERFFDADLREVTAETIRLRALSVPGEDVWVVSLHLAAQNPSVLEALHPDRAGWDAVIFDEAHRMTPTAETFHRVGRELSAAVPHALFLTATPHRGDEYYFRELLHLVDPAVFPTTGPPDGRRSKRGGGQNSSSGAAALTPGALHFLRRMKEELVNYDSHSPLFHPREAHNTKVQMNPREKQFYERAQDLVNEYFDVRGRSLAAMVYGKRTASSLYALAQTLRRRSLKMGTTDRLTVSDDFDEDDDNRETRVVEAGSLNAKAERKAIDEFLAELRPLVGSEETPKPLDGAEVSKWDPVMRRLKVHGINPGAGRQLVVFTEYADTAEWLVAMFREQKFTAKQYSGSQNHSERAAIQKEFMTGRFEVIVSTDAGNEGIDLQAAHVLVNWDIPWSLVRLEQRMGRIHRIGQEQKVYLYNIIALGTREGDAHERLLDRLIEAANELNGKMFDSLNAIIERLNADASTQDTQGLLRMFFEDKAPPDVNWPTVEEIRQARNEHLAELESLSSEVDPEIANTARHDDLRGRVSPHIVERFLGHVADAGLLTLERASIADEGFFYLSTVPSSHGWELPEALRPPQGIDLVATRAEVRDQAIAEGKERAADAVMMGLSDPALTSLIEGLRERVGTEMWQGATLSDQSARDDYTLFVYECEIVEGADNPGTRHRSRHSMCSWLVRVDRAGTAQPVSWGILPNLAPPDATKPPMPLADSVAEAADRQAEQAAEEERQRRADRLDKWVKQLEKLERLPNALTNHITHREFRTTQRSLIEQAIETRINDGRLAAQVTRGEPRRVGWAHAFADRPDMEDIEEEQEAQSEAVSMRFVTDLLTAGGWRVTDVHTEGHGYDLLAARRAEQRCMEVKGRAGSASAVGIILTSGELTAAEQLGDEYWLYVIDHCADGEGRIYGVWQNPWKVFRDRFNDIALVRLAGSELKAALHHQGDHS